MSDERQQPDPYSIVQPFNYSEPPRERRSRDAQTVARDWLGWTLVIGLVVTVIGTVLLINGTHTTYDSLTGTSSRDSAQIAFGAMLAGIGGLALQFSLVGFAVWAGTQAARRHA